MKFILHCLAFAAIAYGKTDEPLIIPCSKTDISCLTRSAQKFLKASVAGIPQYNVLPIDPMTIPHVSFTLETGDEIDLKNVVVTQLENLIIKDFKIDTVEKSVMLAMETEPKIEADMKVNNEYVGKLEYGQGQVGLVANYTYDLIPNKAGIEYFSVGPETLVCDLIGPQALTMTKRANVMFMKAHFKNASTILKQLVCSALDPAFRTIIHNLRECSKIYPKTFFFTDL